jgi:hypothetical protein
LLSAPSAAQRGTYSGVWVAPSVSGSVTLEPIDAVLEANRVAALGVNVVEADQALVIHGVGWDRRLAGPLAVRQAATSQRCSWQQHVL